MIIDMQNDVVEKMLPFAKNIVDNISKILEKFRSKQLPVIHVMRVHKPDGSDVESFRMDSFKKDPFLVYGTDGAEIISELSPRDGELIADKNRFSAFFGTDLAKELREKKIDTLYLVGVQTPNCVRHTAVDAIGHNFNVYVVSDATASKTEQIQKSNLEDMGNMGVNIIDSKHLEVK